MAEEVNIPIITVCSHPEYAQKLMWSASNNGWSLHVVQCEWKGFGTKIIELANYLKANPQITEFIFCDAFDVVFISRPDEFDNLGVTMLFNAEKNCWPVKELETEYPESASEWKYLNSGVFFAKSEQWLKMVEENTPTYEMDDQLYYTELFLSGKYGIQVDSGCEMFQCYSFIADDDFEYREEGLYNRKTNTFPLAIHGNGRTDMSPLNKYL